MVIVISKNEAESILEMIQVNLTYYGYSVKTANGLDKIKQQNKINELLVLRSKIQEKHPDYEN